MTLHFAFDPLSSPALPSALASDIGPYRVEITCSPQNLSKRLGSIRSWLLDWNMPHRLDIERQSHALAIVVSFPEAAPAHACQIQFGGRFTAIDEVRVSYADGSVPGAASPAVFSTDEARFRLGPA